MSRLKSRARRALGFLAALILASSAARSASVLAAEPDRQPTAIYSLNADGTGWRRLYSLEQYHNCSSPAVSPDGKTIAFSGWRLPDNRETGPGKIFAVGIDGTGARELCVGQAPSWSPDGRFFACSRPAKPSGVWIMTADGQEHRHVHGGWGAQWSPDGKKIVYYEGAKLMSYDVDSGEFRPLLAGGANPYQTVFWNMGWSSDSSQICFKGARSEGDEELAIIDAAGAEFGFKARFKTKSFMPDIAWHPRGDRIVFAMGSPERRRSQLFELDPENEGPPILTPGQDATRQNYNPCWTPDGEQLILISGAP